MGTHLREVMLVLLTNAWGAAAAPPAVPGLPERLAKKFKSKLGKYKRFNKKYSISFGFLQHHIISFKPNTMGAVVAHLVVIFSPLVRRIFFP